jgi:hypothetical protein
VSIIQDYFAHDADASGEAFGLPKPTVVKTPATFTSLTEEQVRSAVDGIFDEIVAGLTTPVPPAKVGQRRAWRGSEERVLEFEGRDYAACVEAMNDRFLDWGWSDGFPLVPPTEEAVERMLGGTVRAPEDVIVEKFVPANVRATVRDIAINAVMAGCKPEFLPVVITAIEAMHHPEINLRAMTMSTGPHAPLFLVNGPIAAALQINAGSCALGNAGPNRLSFANVAIGRAVRLCLMNVGGAYPGIMDQDTIGSPAKFSMVLAENERRNPWEPYHVEKGFRAEQSAVTCFYGHSLIEIADMDSSHADALINTFALRIVGIGQTLYMPYHPVVLMAPDHAAVFARDGWTKDDIRKYLHLECSIPAEKYRRSRVMSYQIGQKWIEAADSRSMIPLFEKAENIDIVVTGGVGGKSAAYLGLTPKPYPVRS